VSTRKYSLLNLTNLLETASHTELPVWQVECDVFSSPDWNAFVVHWAGKIKPFLELVLGPYGTEPASRILPLRAIVVGNVAPSASFDMVTGQIELTPSMEGDPGRTLEKLTHEMLHGSLSRFPSDDEFYDEGFVDLSTLLLSQASIYGELGPLMEKSARGNLVRRIKSGMQPNANPYDRRRACGAIHAKLTYGAGLIQHLRTQKMNGTFEWDPPK
jgi:hypothetical protein